MTAPTEQVSTSAKAEPAVPPDTSVGTETRESAREKRRHRPAHLKPHQRWWRIGFPIVLTLLVLSIPLLVWAGVQVVLSSSDGRIVRVVTDPSAPGWEATVDPTPLMALALVDGTGQLDSVAVLSLTGEGSGAVVLLSGATVMAVPGIGNVPLTLVHGSGGVEPVREGVQRILGVGIPEIETLEASAWADLVAPVAPLRVSNPDPVVGTGSPGEVRFQQGTIELSAAEVWPYLSTRNPGESDLNRLVRVEAFWRAWIAAIAGAPDDPAVVPGETQSGLGRFVRDLARGRLDAVIAPVRTVLLDDGGTVYEPETAQMQDLVRQVVPFPSGPEGTRARVTVLDGTGALDHGLGAAVILAANGGQIEKVGNAPEFGVPVTQFVYYDEAARSRVERMRDAIGVGEIVKSDQLNSAVDVTVVLGEDYLRAEPAGSTPTPGLAPAAGGG